MPKVSVVIPVYGVEKYIERCARSLFEQTLDDIEYIFVDDCTPDRSIEILNAIIEEYRPRFARENKTTRIVRMPSNSGLAAVRRHGIQFCTGEYIIHCDSDDWVETDMYELMYNEAKRIDADMVLCGYRTTDGINVQQEYYHTHTDKDGLLRAMLTRNESWATWNKLCRRSLYTSDFIYPQYAMGEDMVMVIQLALPSNIFGIVDKVLYNYFCNPGSIMNTRSEAQLRHRVEAIKNLDVLLSIFDVKGLSKQYEKELLSMKFYQKWALVAYLVISKNYIGDWKSVYPEIDRQAWRLSIIPANIRLKYYMALLILKITSIFSKRVSM